MSSNKVLFKILFKIDDAKKQKRNTVNLYYTLPKPVVIELDRLGYTVTKFISRQTGEKCSKISWGY